MAYLNDLWIPDPNNSRLYKVTGDIKPTTYADCASTPRAVCVDLNMIDVWVVNTGAGTVSQFTSGVRVKDIRVGKSPMGIVQDPTSKALYVTNFNSNSISKIVNGNVELSITVGIGPRGICITPTGNIYVSNYISNTVSKITNDVKVKDIGVGYNPYGICCDKYDDVYVACAGSNIVTKIVGGKKTLDINVQKNPQGICIDKSGDVWVTNYLSNTVSKIENDAVSLNIPVGAGPFAIAPTPDGSIYVANYLGKTISKIYENIVVANIEVCNNPCPFGDFTGYQAYFLHASSGTTSGKVSYDDLDPSLQVIINNAGGGVTSLNDALVTHDNITYSTVKKALDYLLYTAPQITSFTNNVNVIEMGASVVNVNLAWALNKDITSQTISGIGSIPAGTTNKALTGLSITSDTNWTLSVNDGTNTVTKTTSIAFRNKRYWGVSANDTLTNANILALSGEFGTDYSMAKTLDATGGKYLYVAVPSSFNLDVNKFKIGGLANSDWVKNTVQFTNASGYTTSYDIFRSGNSQTGAAIKVDVQ